MTFSERLDAAIRDRIDAEDLRFVDASLGRLRPRGGVELKPLLVRLDVEQEDDLPERLAGTVERFGCALPYETRLVKVECDWGQDGRSVLVASYLAYGSNGETVVREYREWEECDADAVCEPWEE